MTAPESSNLFRTYLIQVLSKKSLSVDEMSSAMGLIMDGAASEAEIAAFLTALRMKGESATEVTGAADAMRTRVTSINTEINGLLDTCGTGGDSCHTFNISTAAAFVVAAMGVPVAKHGNRSVSSSSGSADVLEALGVNIQLSPEQVARSIEEVGIGFCFAPLLHGAMKYAAPVRRQLGFRTIFNLLGPLTNPANAEFQLIGTNSLRNAELLAEAILHLGCQRATVVCGAGELDEVSLWGDTTVYEIAGGQLQQQVWNANTFGLSECSVSDLRVNSPEESKQVVLSVLNGSRNAARDIVIANAAAAFMTCNITVSAPEAAELAADSIDSGRVSKLLEALVEASQSNL